MALGRWAQLADPSWDFDAAFARFRAGYQLPLDATASVRGSQAGEMMARCIVETGTSSYYSALQGRDRRAGAEADLRPRSRPTSSATTSCSTIICSAASSATASARWRAAADRLGPHRRERGRRARLRLLRRQRAAGRAVRPRRAQRAYARRAYPLYRPLHVQRAMAMVLKAVGLGTTGWLNALHDPRRPVVPAQPRRQVRRRSARRSCRSAGVPPAS